ncbi:hypothetical protein JO84_gp330 [Aureococcus anophagefferens virus]|uniref:Uncharacterized protein n=1 Tax=Aureococcus anophagefferens virus TaxID=1474867 RepID=A0A076FHT9_9VIRU|nr:hypothetical protein JO84_gp330 [Aureococcus anophagefferens virus]AII16996.1 hypothetical protein AaV_143 [Aureococcus anophagefferens virus]UOG94057.1 hypothetical protein MKD35_15 [Aureococcus anophagefferens virus]
MITGLTRIIISFSKQKIVKMPAGTPITYEDYKDFIVETEEEFNAIVAAKKAKDKEDGKRQFQFDRCKFKFKFPDGKDSELTMVCAWKDNPKKPPSERNKEKSDKAKARAKDPENNNYAIEEKSIEQIFEIINEKQDSNIEIKVVGLEGCHVDVAVRIKGSNEDIWCPIQIKSSNAEEIPQFCMERYKCPEEFKDKYEKFGYYENMLTICHNMKIDEFLIIPPHSNDKIPDTSLTFNSGVNKEFGVKKDKIYDIIIEYIRDYSATLGKPHRELQLICNEKYKLEIEHIHLRIDTFSEIFDMKEISGKAFDFIINDSIKIQEKTVNAEPKCNGNSFKFKLAKSDEKGKYQPYAINDNDFYWFNLAGTKYFYVIPSELLERDRNIRDSLTLHKEFNINTRGPKYNDKWTYDFRFDRTKPDDIECLWNLIHSEF